MLVASKQIIHEVNGEEVSKLYVHIWLPKRRTKS